MSTNERPIRPALGERDGSEHSSCSPKGTKGHLLLSWKIKIKSTRKKTHTDFRQCKIDKRTKRDKALKERQKRMLHCQLRVGGGKDAETRWLAATEIPTSFVIVVVIIVMGSVSSELDHLDIVFNKVFVNGVEFLSFDFLQDLFLIAQKVITIGIGT
jgi:hypothetical protein